MRVYQFRHVGTVAANLLLIYCLFCCVFCIRGQNYTGHCASRQAFVRNYLHSTCTGMKKAADSVKSLRLLCGILVVPTEGLEPPHLAAHGPEPCASTNSATWALMLHMLKRVGFVPDELAFHTAHQPGLAFLLCFRFSTLSLQETKIIEQSCAMSNVIFRKCLKNCPECVRIRLSPRFQVHYGCRLAYICTISVSPTIFARPDLPNTVNNNTIEITFEPNYTHHSKP